GRACGPAIAVAQYVLEGFRTVQISGKVRCNVPLLEEMDKIGERAGSGADETDEIIRTDFDSPPRSVIRVTCLKCSDRLSILSGGDGSREEAIVALAT